MDQARMDQAMSRIEAALARIEAASERPAAAGGALAEKHDALRLRVADALAELDELIGDLER